jgi:hypothetical protein
VSDPGLEGSDEIQAALDRDVRFLRSLRDNADRGALGLSVESRQKGLTQTELADAISDLIAPKHHLRERRLRDLEALRGGRPGRADRTAWPQHVADAYAQVLQLREPELSRFYAAVHCVPETRSIEPDNEVTEADRFFVAHTLATTPSYISDPLWDFRYRNAALQALLPDLVLGINVMEFVMLSTRGREVFPDWEEWAAPMLDQLRTVLVTAAGERKTGLEKVLSTLLADSEVARLWRRHPRIDLGPNGQIRTLRPADPAAPDGLGPRTRVQLYSTEPVAKRPGWRIMSVTVLDHLPAEPVDVDPDPEFWFRGTSPA